MKKNYNKLDFGRTINELGKDGFITSDVCHNYGSISGCDDGCPALWDGECRNIEEVLESVDFSEDEVNEIKNIYKLIK